MEDTTETIMVLQAQNERLRADLVAALAAEKIALRIIGEENERNERLADLLDHWRKRALFAEQFIPKEDPAS